MQLSEVKQNFMKTIMICNLTLISFVAINLIFGHSLWMKAILKHIHAKLQEDEVLF
jgi:hypothetical protein